jgi:serine/threonine-protein kinase HipA
MNRCLYCYQPLENDEADYHATCSKKFFGFNIPLLQLKLDKEDIEAMALQVIKSHIAVTGVQKKISLNLAPDANNTKVPKLTIVGLWGSFILKPPSEQYPFLPEVEDLTMHLAETAKIRVVPHALIRLQSGDLAYITKRIDRKKNAKIHMEDMCQLTERLTEDKYRGSYEQIAKAITSYSATPGLDVVNFYEQVLFSFLTGNADMHLKNFSLIHNQPSGYVLSPAYDLVATALVNPEDDEDLALTLNARKKKIKRSDFITAFTSAGLLTKQQENIFSKMNKAKKKWLEFIDLSFLPDHFKKQYKDLIRERFRRLEE